MTILVLFVVFSPGSVQVQRGDRCSDVCRDQPPLCFRRVDRAHVKRDLGNLVQLSPNVNACKTLSNQNLTNQNTARMDNSNEHKLKGVRSRAFTNAME